MNEETKDRFIRNYVCDCDHTDIMHSEHDGCSLCDCERNRETVIAIGKLFHEYYAIKRQLNDAEEFHPRAMKLISKKKNFLVVACDEPYFRNTYDVIKKLEVDRGRWTDEDERLYQQALRKLEE